MENRIYGTLVVVIATVLFYVAFKKYKSQQYDICLAMIVLAGLVLRVFTSCDFFLHEWDERFHALVAKNLINDPSTPMLYAQPLLEYDYKNWANNHIWVHKQPTPLYAMAMSMWIFGKNVIALRLPSIILSTIGIISTYKIGEILSSKRTAIIAAFLCAVNGLIIEQTAGRVATDHIDVFFFALISIAVYLLLKHANNGKKTFLVLGSVITGLAILTKWLPALIVFPIWLIYRYKKDTVKSILIDSFTMLFTIAIVAIPWQLYINYNFPVEAAWEQEYNKLHVFEVLGPHGHPFYFHFDRMRIIFGELIYLPLLWLIYITFKSNFAKRNLILLVWIVVPYIFFSIVKTKMHGYILFCAPAIFIMTALFIEYLRINKFKYRKLTNLICMLLLVLPIRYGIERIKPFAIKERTQDWISKVEQIDMGDSNTLKVIFNCKYPIETMFHTDVVAYDRIPSKDKIEEIRSLGYSIYMDNHNEIDIEVQNLSFVKYVRISKN